jgi:branched-chain amino acid transport system ATP-binding protein
MPVLQVEETSVSFGGVHALHEVSLGVEAGAVTGLIGPNGAGKTTLFNVITGLQRPSRGRVVLDDRDITKARSHVRARLGLARTFQRLEIFGSLTARENVLVAAELRRGLAPRSSNPHATAQAILTRVGLEPVADEPADSLPTGLARLLELGRALATNPRVLLLDEPSAGLDQSETGSLGDLLGNLADEGMAVLLVEHDVELVMSVCAQVYVLDFGDLIAHGTPEEVRGNEAVQLAYLGAEDAAAGDNGAAAGGGGHPPPGDARAGTVSEKGK